MNIDTALFDLDGTLINTNELIITSFKHVLDEYKPGEYAREDILTFIGPPLTESFKSVDPERADEMIKKYQEHNKAYHDELVTEYEGVKETVKTLYDKGYKLAVVTTKKSNTAYLGVEAAGLTPYFSHVITFDDVEKVKPNPEPLNQAMDALGSKPEQTIMVGDSHYDILGGKNAGTYTAGVSWSIKGADHLRSYEPDVMLENMTDLLSFLGVKDG